MYEVAIIGMFVVTLVTTLVIDAPIPVALIIGYVIFFNYGLHHDHEVGDLLRMSAKGLKTVLPILALFAIIGMLTASWRAAGTIPAIACASTRVIGAGTLVPLTFLLCCAMSMLMGSSFGTSATMGVICMTIGTTMGVNPALMGGAILSGSFFGDRCSPMSSSAALVATLTGTELFDNVNRMMRTAVAPFLLSVALYVVLGAGAASTAAIPDLVGPFAETFDLSVVVFLPALVVLALSLAKVDVRRTMLASLACALVITVTVQGQPLESLPGLLLWGYHAPDPQIAGLVNGGGIVSMAEIALIVATVSTYSGLFSGTGLLDNANRQVTLLARRTTPFVGVLATSLITSFIACDQVLVVMLADQLCDRTEHDGRALALDLENSAILVPALTPWSTSCAGILSFVGAPVSSILFACFAYLVPLWTLAISLFQRRNPAFAESRAAHVLGLDERDDVRRWLDAEGNLA